MNEIFFLDERQRPSIQLTVPKSTNWWIFNRNSRKIIISLEEIDSWNLGSNNKKHSKHHSRSLKLLLLFQLLIIYQKNSHSKLFLWIERLVPRNENNQKNEKFQFLHWKKLNLEKFFKLSNVSFWKLRPFLIRKSWSFLLKIKSKLKTVENFTCFIKNYLITFSN